MLKFLPSKWHTTRHPPHGLLCNAWVNARMGSTALSPGPRDDWPIDLRDGCRVSVSLEETQHPPMRQLLVPLWSEDWQDIAEYAVMVAVILIIVVGTLRIIGSNSNTVFSTVASSIGAYSRQVDRIIGFLRTTPL